MRALLTSLATLCLAAASFAQPNVLLIIADDVGVDRVGAYGEHPHPGHTPVIDKLAKQGILFRNAWSNSMCSPSRATLLTGRYSFRTGLGTSIEDHYPSRPIQELDLEEVTLPKILRPTYQTAAVGKWHLGSVRGTGPAHPLLMGFEHHHGSFRNLAKSAGAAAYFDWEKNVDGTLSRSRTYATTDTVDEALDLIARFSAPPDPRPWFLWLAFNASHKPYHKPPAHLHRYRLPNNTQSDPLYMKALTEAMDTEIGRLLSSMGARVRANTIIIFVGDNGTANSAMTRPFESHRGKGMLFEGGINVPLIITGTGVLRGAECTGLVNTTDIFATVAELAGLPLVGFEDSVSLVPYLQNPGRPSLRRWVYAERFWTLNGVTTHQRAIREARYKLKVVDKVNETGASHTRNVRFYDLDLDPFERSDLSAQPLSTPQRTVFLRLLEWLEQPDPAVWSSVGGGSMDASGVPALIGTGPLLPGTAAELRLSYAPSLAPALLAIRPPGRAGTFRDGVAVSRAGLAIAFPVTARQGLFQFRRPRPSRLPPGFTASFQCWIAVPSAPLGWVASNALQATPP